jgi:hypothetical protein
LPGSIYTNRKLRWNNPEQITYVLSVIVAVVVMAEVIVLLETIVVVVVAIITTTTLDVKLQVKLSHYCHAGDEGERRYSSFLTLALDGGEWSMSHPSCALPWGKGPPVPLDRRLGAHQSWSG